MVRKRVVILFRYIPQYRLPFLIRLQELCRARQIDLKVVYGTPAREDDGRADRVDFAAGVFVRNYFVTLGKYTAVLQPVLSHIKDADLIIVEQQSKLVLNYLLISQQIMGKRRVAFFGHGKNLQATDDRTLPERAKKWMALLPHWWFVYTDGVSEYVRQLGYPADRITVFHNAIDTKRLFEWRSTISADEVMEAQRALNLTSEHICIYLGSMYPEKRMSFLIAACKHIRSHVPDFSMLFVGAGSDALMVKRFCDESGWAHYLGPLFGRDKVKYCMMAKLLLMPGAVGLAILDAFAMRIPIVTTDVPFHGPEIDYLKSGDNGLMVTPADDSSRYASAVSELLSDPSRLKKMADNSEYAASRLTIESMAEHFFEGIVRALAIE